MSFVAQQIQVSPWIMLFAAFMGVFVMIYVYTVYKRALLRAAARGAGKHLEDREKEEAAKKAKLQAELDTRRGQEPPRLLVRKPEHTPPPEEEARDPRLKFRPRSSAPIGPPTPEA